MFSGAVARDLGGRWNGPGTEVIYASASFSCAMLEQPARAGIGHLPKGQVWIEINVPAILIEVAEPEDIPGWDQEDRLASQAYGDHWLKGQRSAVLVVPSVVANGLEKNVIINPAHKDFGKISCSERHISNLIFVRVRSGERVPERRHLLHGQRAHLDHFEFVPGQTFQGVQFVIVPPGVGCPRQEPVSPVVGQDHPIGLQCLENHAGARREPRDVESGLQANAHPHRWQ